jgi:hypothetical protein
MSILFVRSTDFARGPESSIRKLSLTLYDDVD